MLAAAVASANAPGLHAAQHADTTPVDTRYLRCCTVLQGSPLQQLNVSDSSRAKLKELLPEMPDKGPAL
jgi:hypothetical protein